MAEDDVRNDSTTAAPPWFFWCFAVLSLLLFLGSGSLWPTEARFAEAAREMLEAEDLRRITLNGEPVQWRPFGAYYAVLFSSWLVGAVDELAVRLPGVAAALLVLLSVRRMGIRLFGREAGAAGAWLLLGCGGFLFMGRIGGADMANAAAIMLALAWFYARRKHPGFFSYLLFYLVVFVGAQFKGLPAVMPVFVLMLPSLLRDGAWKKHLRWSHPAALILAFGFYLLPHYLFFSGDHGEFLRQTLLDGSIEQLRVDPSERSPFFSYLYELPRSLTPWTILILTAVAGLFADFRRLIPAAQDLLLGVVMVLVLLTLMPVHHYCYLLTILPPLAALVGYALAGPGAGRPRWNAAALGFMRFVFVIASSIAVVSIIIMPFWRQILGFSLPWQLPVMIFVLGVLSLWVLLADEFGRRDTIRDLTGLGDRIGGIIFAGSIISCGFFSVLQLQYYVPATSREFLAEMSDQLGEVAPENILYWGDSPPLRMLFYMKSRTPMRHADNASELREALSGRTRRLVLLSSTNPEKRRSLAAAAAECGLKFDLDKPQYSEHRRPFEADVQEKLVVYFIDTATEN